jgi:hypothetical protein
VDAPDPRGAPRPFPASLCHRCEALELVHGKNSSFLRCLRLAQKYPPQPVRSCELFTARAMEERAERGD